MLKLTVRRARGVEGQFTRKCTFRLPTLNGHIIYIKNVLTYLTEMCLQGMPVPSIEILH